MKKRIIAVVMMVVMLMSAMGSVAYAAEATTPDLAVEFSETEDGTEMQISIFGDFAEFEVAVAWEGMEEGIGEMYCNISSELSDVAAENDGLVQSGFQYPTNYAAIGGVFAEPISYSGVIGSVIWADGLADGTTVSVYLNGELYTTVGYTSGIYGDVDGNGAVEAADALLVLKAVVKLETLTEVQIGYADVDGIGNVEAADALLILQKVVKLIDKFPVEMGE